MYAPHIKKCALAKTIEFPKSARAHRWISINYWKEPRSYFACTKVTSYRIWLSPMGRHCKLSYLWTNKMIGFTCQIGQLKIFTCAADGNGVGRRNSRWSLPSRIHWPWGQNKYRILSEKCLKESIEGLGRQTFRPHTMAILTGLNTTALSKRQLRMA